MHISGLIPKWQNENVAGPNDGTAFGQPASSNVATFTSSILYLGSLWFRFASCSLVFGPVNWFEGSLFF